MYIVYIDICIISYRELLYCDICLYCDYTWYISSAWFIDIRISTCFKVVKVSNLLCCTIFSCSLTAGNAYIPYAWSELLLYRILALYSLYLSHSQVGASVTSLFGQYWNEILLEITWLDTFSTCYRMSAYDITSHRNLLVHK